MVSIEPCDQRTTVRLEGIMRRRLPLADPSAPTVAARRPFCSDGRVRVAVFSTKAYDRRTLEDANHVARHELRFLEPRLSLETSALARGFAAVCAFVNDELDAPVLETLAAGDTRFVVLRCAGFNHVGIVGLGAIGVTVAQILTGFGAELVGSDPAPHPDFVRLGGRVVPRDELLAASDVVTLHCPLLPATHHLIDERALGRMKPGAMLVNTGRGALVDTAAAIEALKSGRLGALAIDVYEEEADLFFEDLSDRVLQDDVLARLLTFPNVLVTGHQGFFTEEALSQIAATTIANLTALEQGIGAAQLVRMDRLRA
jgi:D-lactate dehydrogenase